MKKRILALLIALILALPFCVDFNDASFVYAASVQDKINQASKQKQEALDKIKQAEKQKDDILAESDELEREIDIIQTEIYAIDDIIADADAKILENEEEIAKIQGDIEFHILTLSFLQRICQSF